MLVTGVPKLARLRPKRGSWDAETTYAAVVGGGQDCLKYAHERGCPWVVAKLIAVPLTVKSRRCLEYVREQAPAEAAAYDASVHIQCGSFVRHMCAARSTQT
jgi:hypothetical protein